MKRIEILMLVLLVLAACAHVNDTKQPAPAPRVSAPTGDTKGSSAAPRLPASPSTTSQQHHEKKQIEITTRDPQKGIDAYENELAKHPHDQILTKDYVKNLEELRTSADRASELGNLAEAGRLYVVLLKNYHEFVDLQNKLSFNKDYLYLKLTYCKTTLSKRGFEEYRKGNVDEALRCWQGYLSIDPNNTDIKKAVQTASMQRKNLEQKR